MKATREQNGEKKRDDSGRVKAERGRREDRCCGWGEERQEGNGGRRQGVIMKAGR